MIPDLDLTGADWLSDQVGHLTDRIVKLLPSEFIERNRYLPESVTSLSGLMSFDVNPFMIEIVDNLSPDSPIEDFTLMKGVQTTYTTSILESAWLFAMAHLKTIPIAFITAEKELADSRRENNIIPMVQQSGFQHCVQSSDESSNRKLGSTKDHMQWKGGGYGKFLGANNPRKARTFNFAWLLQDEIDAWPIILGIDGDSVRLFDDRTLGYRDQRKIARGSTPLLMESSRIYRYFLRGDQRRYFVRCLKCGYPQYMRWKDGKGGFYWETEGGLLVPESVAYRCSACQHHHHEYDKTDLFCLDNAQWAPTAKPAAKNVRSYHLPAFYSPPGMQSWSDCVQTYLDGFDPINNKVTNIGLFQVFYNNILAKPFETTGARVPFLSVRGHKRAEYKYGTVPNKFALEHNGSRIKFLTCIVDVQKRYLSIAVMGWSVNAICYLVDYIEAHDNTGGEDGTGSLESPAWAKLRDIIEKKTYRSDDGIDYPIFMTLVDSRYNTGAVTSFCDDYDGGGVYPIMGQSVVGKSQKVREFGEWNRPVGITGYHIVVDIYKERLAPVLKRSWNRDMGAQRAYHFNAPTDATDDQLRELTREKRVKETDKHGIPRYIWERKTHEKNELWDLLVYGHAAVDILAWQVCVNQYRMEYVDWHSFWNFDKFVT